jgi:hypothetical protein
VRPAAALFVSFFLFSAAVPAYADDIIILKDGKKYTGSILFHTDTQYCIAVDGKAERVNITDIKKIDFDPAHDGNRPK